MNFILLTLLLLRNYIPNSHCIRKTTILLRNKIYLMLWRNYSIIIWKKITKNINKNLNIKIKIKKGKKKEI
jgi:hypothetical protein